MFRGSHEICHILIREWYGGVTELEFNVRISATHLNLKITWVVASTRA